LRAHTSRQSTRFFPRSWAAMLAGLHCLSFAPARLTPQRHGRKGHPPTGFTFLSPFSPPRNANCLRSHFPPPFSPLPRQNSSWKAFCDFFFFFLLGKAVVTRRRFGSVFGRGSFLPLSVSLFPPPLFLFPEVPKKWRYVEPPPFLPAEGD